jgi:hypothetical protein
MGAYSVFLSAVGCASSCLQCGYRHLGCACHLFEGPEEKSMMQLLRDPERKSDKGLVRAQGTMTGVRHPLAEGKQGYAGLLRAP